MCKFYANFIAISLFCGLLAINVPAWAQIYSHKMKYSCGGMKQAIFNLPPPLSVQQQIDSSTFVFIGNIVSQKTINYQDREYVCATIAVEEIFKGEFVTDTVEVLSYYGYNRNDTRYQYRGTLGYYDCVFFVNQNKVFHTELPSGRLRFRLAALTGSSNDWFHFCGRMDNDFLEKEISAEETKNRLKALTNKRVKVISSKKKAK